jgi:hypothetical protein
LTLLSGDVGELLRQVLHGGACGLLHGFADGGAGQGAIDCSKQGAHAAIDAQGLGEHFFEQRRFGFGARHHEKGPH